jgi:hypothetical protein
MKNKIIYSLCASSLIFTGLSGCKAPPLAFARQKNISENNISRTDAQNCWIKMLNEKNPQLHDAVVGAMLLSKDSNKEIFILRNIQPDSTGLIKRSKYRLSTIRGDAENILSVDFKNKYISFDHFNESEGPSIETAYDKVFVDHKINLYYAELNIK